MRSGTIDLISGKWYWTILPRWTGSTVVYQHRNRVHDEMRNWTPEAELTENQALELALEPLERVWVDVDGLKWRLSMELPSGWRKEVRGAGAGRTGMPMLLVFSRGGVRRSVEVPGNSRLGDLTHAELKALLEEAFGGSARARSGN